MYAFKKFHTKNTLSYLQRIYKALHWSFKDTIFLMPYFPVKKSLKLNKDLCTFSFYFWSIALEKIIIKKSVL